MNDMQRFQACAESHGAERHRWPPRDRPLFDALSATPQGERVLAMAAQVDALLDTWDAPEPSADLLHRTARQARPAEVPGPPPGRLRRWLPVGGLALSLLMGFALGFQRAHPDDAGLEAMGRMLVDPSGVQGGAL